MYVRESTLVMGQITPQVAVPNGFSPVIDNYARDDIAIANNLLALAATQRATRRMTGGLVSNPTTVYTNVPDLTVPVNRVGGLAFQYWLLYFTNISTEGIGVQLAFSGTANGIGYSIEAYINAATRADLVYAEAFGTGVAPYTEGPGLTLSIIEIRGSCFVTAVGDLTVQLRAETGGINSATLTPPSWGQVWSS